MAPEGKTHLVVEYFCFSGDAVWTATDTGARAAHGPRVKPDWFYRARKKYWTVWC